jgi:tetratricopeptide (TPR) repeat protein
MSVQEQQSLQEKYYSEAIRYMDNAKECLQKARKEDNYYRDPKYVKMACGTAYSGVLVALDGFLVLKGLHKPKGKERKSIEYYQSNITKIDKKMLDYLNGAYQILHLSGYYDGMQNAKVIKEGFDEAYKIIDKIKPAS